jgi:hypothetical protein
VFRLGPRLGAAWFSTISESEAALDAIAFGTFRWSNESTAGPRLVLGIGPSLGFVQQPRSFLIEHQLHPGVGVHATAGLGIERFFSRGSRLAFIDFRAETRAGHLHPHHLEDTRTGETLRERVTITRFSLVIAAGLMWTVAR